MYLKLSVLFAALFFASCATNAPECGGPQSKNLAAAIDSTQTSLINGCHAHFDHYYDDLLSIAEGDPKPENKQAFSEFLVWSSDQGLLSKRQAQDYYNRYFNTTFISLPDDYNVCSSCTGETIKNIEDQMENELRQKEEGLLRACRDKGAYYTASDQYNSILLLLDATCTSCRN